MLLRLDVSMFKQLTFTRHVSRDAMRLRGSSLGCSCFCSTTPMELHSEEQEVIIAMGSNTGDRIGNFDNALRLMRNNEIDITRHGLLYETAPAYMTDQPHFLNSAVRACTRHTPHELLRVLKQIEMDLGRRNGVRYGPRPMDLDILFYGKSSFKSKTLSVPHEKIRERPFVVAPLVDVLGSEIENDTVAFWHSWLAPNTGLVESWERVCHNCVIGRGDVKRVLPIGGSLWDWTGRTSVMGILNLTPDSFSDGGKFCTVDAAVSRVSSMVREGVDIIDLGPQSTRPMASTVSPQEELKRLVPILEAVKNMHEMQGKWISVDTYYSGVASEAIHEGAHMVNDISGGYSDPEMYSTVSRLRAPYVMMHMRGDPVSMQNVENLEYKNVCKEVAFELYARVKQAEILGIPAWRIILDPGIGFSKTAEHNLEILKGLPSIRNEIARKSYAASRAPILVGPSRKKFLGKFCNLANAADRDPATVAAITTAILGGANIIRVHNVKDNVIAARLCDALLRCKS